MGLIMNNKDILIHSKSLELLRATKGFVIAMRENPSIEESNNFRSYVRQHIDIISNLCYENYSEGISRLLIAPLLAYVDEKCSILSSEVFSKEVIWLPLLFSYYECNNGGEYAFDLYDQIISNKIYPDIIYINSYYILNEGFEGRYYETANKKDLNKYLTTFKNICLDISGSLKSNYVKCENKKPINHSKMRNNVYKFLFYGITITIPLTLYLITLKITF